METGEKTLEIMQKADWYNNWLLGHFKKYLRDEILEIGSGIGNFTGKMKLFGKVIAIDYNPKYKNAGFGDIEKGKYFFGRKKFDAIVCMNVLEHIKNHKRALENMNELLKKEGNLILLVPAFNFAYSLLDKNLGHYRRYTKGELEKLLGDSGFEVCDLRYLNPLGLAGWFINGKVLGREIIPEGQLGLFDKLARPFLVLENFIKFPFGLSVLAIAKKI